LFIQVDEKPYKVECKEVLVSSIAIKYWWYQKIKLSLYSWRLWKNFV